MAETMVDKTEPMTADLWVSKMVAKMAVKMAEQKVE